jgi:hypothetical protein
MKGAVSNDCAFFISGLDEAAHAERDALQPVIYYW